MRLAGTAGPKKIAKNSPAGHHRTTLSGYIFATKTRIDNRKKLVKQQYLPHVSYNMVNFGLLAAEIVSWLWCTPANFNGFRVLAALLHGTLLLGVSTQRNFAALNRWRHLYSAGWSSRWALAHILVRFVLVHLHSKLYARSTCKSAQIEQVDCGILPFIKRLGLRVVHFDRRIT